MDEKLDKIIEQQHKIRGILGTHKHVLADIQEDLAEHMRRTAAVEKQVAEIMKLKHYVIGGLIVASLLSDYVRSAIETAINLAK